MKKKERPYIRSAKIISEPHHRPKAKIICITDQGRRQLTRILTHAEDMHWLAKAFLKTLTSPPRIIA